jgi:hypothetical protein
MPVIISVDVSESESDSKKEQDVYGARRHKPKQAERRNPIG